MLDCNEKLTLVSFQFDANSRSNHHVITYIDNASWNLTSEWSEQDKKLVSKDIVKVRIPISDTLHMLQIKKGDILIRGHITSLEGMSTGQILNQYEAITIQSLSYNVKAQPYSRHIRVSGS